MIGDILQPTHLLFILVVALLVLGPKRLPEVGRALGRGLRDFRSALNTDDLRDQMISTTSTQSNTATVEEPTEHFDAPPQSDTAATSETSPFAASTETESKPVETAPESPSPEAATPGEPTASSETATSASATDHAQ